MMTSTMTMKRTRRTLLHAALACAALCALAARPAHAKLRVTATIETLADVARQVGGDRVEVEALSRGTQDPHFVPAKPSLVLALNKADVLVQVGLDLEIGWLPPLVQQSRNARIQVGQPGNVDCSAAIEVRDVPNVPADKIRALGDVHPLGNPHYWIPPDNALAVARLLASRFTALDAAGGGIYVEFGSAALVNSTISGNSAHDSGGLRVYQATVTLDNTIASANIATNAASVATRDLGQGPFASVAAHYSLLGSALNVAPFNAGANHNVFSNSPGLGNLQDNGGPTRTMALASNSPAVDAGSKALALSAGKPLNYDQRTLPWLRLFDDKVDIGAFEYQGDRIFAAIFEPLP